MELSVINIGNSKGIRLPKAVLKKYNIQDKIELVFEKGYLILKPKTEPRKDWEKSFKKMRKNGDDQLLIDDLFDDETFDEWK